MSNTTNTTIMNEEFFAGVCDYIKQKTMLEGDPEDIQLIFKSTLECMAQSLAENRSEGEEAKIVFPGYIEMKATEREGNFGVGITAEEELKKRIKDDKEKDILEDDEDEDDE